MYLQGFIGITWNSTKSCPNTICTLLFKSIEFFFSNAYLRYQYLIFWSKLPTWHLPNILCEISYTYDYSSRQSDHSKPVRFEKRDIKALANGTVFSGYFAIWDRWVWEFKLFYFMRYEWGSCIKSLYGVFGSWNEINLFITKYNTNRQFWITLITISGLSYPYYDL